MKTIMKKVSCLLALLLLVATMFADISLADDVKPVEKPTGEVAVSALSAYIWRGQEMTRNSVVVQPSATISYKGFTFNAWGNLDTKPYSAANANYAGKHTETDFTLSYSKKFGILTVTPGYIYYALGAPNTGAAVPLDSQEVFLTLGLDTILSPTLTAYKEIDHYHQWYFLLGVSHTFALHEKVGLKLAATASYLASNDENTYARYNSNAVATTDKYNNFHDATVSISLPVAVTKSLTLTPTASYVFPLCDDAKYEMKGRGLQGVTSPTDRNSSFLYGGVALSFAF
ncbi:MAG: hypothetical protein CVU52_10135 [Deltaproteobacteria bacterium HGW-Deltaproteobacteria-10]|nr:MAG: hypothetical protein CVU52_10135 [Deltaproteobacteria bacterium HGW-Deltaproteobacteria-10]